MQHFFRFVILALVFASFVSQAQIPRRTNSLDRKRDAGNSKPEPYAGLAADEAAWTIAGSSKVNTGFEFLRRINQGIVKELKNAWLGSALGTNGCECVVLIVRRGDGTYTGIFQGFTNEYKQFTLKWNPAALAIVHTHPNNSDPKPSQQDQRIAERFSVPIFTLTLMGMYAYNPVTHITSKVMNGLDWLDPAKWQETRERLKECNTQGFESCYLAR